MKLIIANWKNNPASEADAIELAKATDAEGLVICPPAEFLRVVGEVLKKSMLGTQDLFWNGLPPANVKYVIIGHSSRRGMGETNEMIAKKMAEAVKEDLIPILCVGEALEEKKAGLREKVLSEQLKIGLSEIVNCKLKIENLYIAYEPVWAISINPGAVPDTPEQAQSTINFIKQELVNFGFQISDFGFLYGGSVNADNAESFLKLKEIDGALVGGASLKKDQIWKISHYQKVY